MNTASRQAAQQRANQIQVLQLALDNLEREGVVARGYITELHADKVNVPLAYRAVFANNAPYEVTLAFGKRLEAWITAAAKHVAIK